MRFCPDCGKMLIPVNNKIKCECGYEDEISDEAIEKEYQFEGEKTKENEIIVTDNNNVALQQRKLPAISVEEQKDIGGQSKQGLQMKLQHISSDVQNVETFGAGLTNS